MLSEQKWIMIWQWKHSPFSYCPYTDASQEIPCDLGYYSTGNASSCEMCPPGYECPVQDQAIRCEKRIIIHLLREKK